MGISLVNFLLENIPKWIKKGQQSGELTEEETAKHQADWKKTCESAAAQIDPDPEP